jgi:hypothetical protein
MVSQGIGIQWIMISSILVVFLIEEMNMRINIDDENYIDVVELMKGPLEIYNLELMHFMYFCQILSN